MPKGQITEEELASGLRGMSGLSPLARTKRDSPFRDSRSEAKAIDIRPVQPEIRLAPSAQMAAVPSARVEDMVKRPNKPRKAQLVEPQAGKEKASQRKADIYTERVTLQISPQMRDAVDSLARSLQRTKVSKTERITANTVMRVAIRSLLEHFKNGANCEVNDEEELYNLAKRGKSAFDDGV